MLRYLSAFIQDVSSTWKGLLSGTIGIALMFVGAHTPVTPLIVYPVAAVALGVSFFMAWLHQFRKREAAEAALSVNERRRQLRQQIDSLVYEGRQIQRMKNSLDRVNYKHALTMKDDWHQKVRQFTYANNPSIRPESAIPAEFQHVDWTGDIDASIESLDRLRDTV